MTAFGYILIIGLLLVSALIAWGVRDSSVDEERPYDREADGDL